MAILGIYTAAEEKELRNFNPDHMLQHPFIFSDEKKYRVQRHVVFWTFWWIFQGFLYSFIAAFNGTDWWLRLQMSMVESLIFLVAHIFLAYSLMYFVIPRFLLKQRYWLTAGWTLLLFAATAGLSVLLGVLVIDKLRLTMFDGIFSNRFRNNNVSLFLSLLAGLRGAITVGGIAAAIKLMKYWYLKEQRNMQLQKENMTSQLQLLKAQIHPHFLFNTLNNIYSYTQSGSPRAAGMITGLSDILRYMLYECNQPLVPLAKEIKLAEDYISLEKIRYGNKLELHIDLPDETNELYIAPLLLLPLIENCFKHGTSHMLEQPWINLQMSITGQHLQMKLINGKINTGTSNPEHTGIGIQNVQKRLSLLYPDRHELSITDEEEVFIVHLKIKLDPPLIRKQKSKKEDAPVHA